MAEEGIKKTDNELIFIGKPIPFEVEKFLQQLEKLANASYENSPDIVSMVEKIVPTFHPVGEKPDEKADRTPKGRISAKPIANINDRRATVV